MTRGRVDEDVRILAGTIRKVKKSDGAYELSCAKLEGLVTPIQSAHLGYNGVGSTVHAELDELCISFIR